MKEVASIYKEATVGIREKILEVEISPEEASEVVKVVKTVPKPIAEAVDKGKNFQCKETEPSLV